MQPSLHRLARTLALAVMAVVLMLPAAAQAESLHVIFPQTAEVTVVQGSSTDFTLEVQAFGATQCSATTVPVIIDTHYAVDAAGTVTPSAVADMPIQTDQNRGTSENCDIHNPVLVPLSASASSDTPVGDYTSVIRYGKGGDGDIDLDGPALTIHVVPPPAAPVIVQPVVPPPQIIVLSERVTPKPKPVLGKSVMLTRIDGTVTYVAPGQAMQTLTDPVIVPNGTKVDATNGTLQITAVRDRSGTLDSALTWDGAFGVNQGIEKNGKGLTTFSLRDGFGSNGKKNGASAARVRAAKATRKRSLWVNAKGNFKTRGKRASAITRGTVWHTEETDRGTKVSVQTGEVAVRDLVKKKTILVKTGQSYTATAKTHAARRLPVFTG